MTWSLSASGAVDSTAGDPAALEADLLADLQPILANPKYGVVATFFNGSSTGTRADLHLAEGEASASVPPSPAPPASTPPADTPPAPAPDPAPVTLPDQPVAAVPGDGDSPAAS